MKYSFLIFCFLISQINVAQTIPDTTTTTTQDTSSINQSKNSFGDLVKGKPGRAALYSLILPGGGQAYNKKWWKVPLAIGIDAYTLYNVIQSRKQYKDYQDLYLTALNENGTSTEISRYKILRNAYRKKYDYSRVYFVIGHFVTVFDAYIDRHLMDFDISEDLSISPTMIDTKFNMGLSLSYSLNGHNLRKTTHFDHN